MNRVWEKLGDVQSKENNFQISQKCLKAKFEIFARMRCFAAVERESVCVFSAENAGRFRGSFPLSEWRRLISLQWSCVCASECASLQTPRQTTVLFRWTSHFSCDQTAVSEPLLAHLQLHFLQSLVSASGAGLLELAANEEPRRDHEAHFWRTAPAFSSICLLMAPLSWLLSKAAELIWKHRWESIRTGWKRGHADRKIELIFYTMMGF